MQIHGIEKQVRDAIDKAKAREQKQEFDSMITAFQNMESHGNNFEGEHEVQSVDIEPIITKKYNEYELSFKIGKKRMYKIKSIMEFSKTFK